MKPLIVSRNPIVILFSPGPRERVRQIEAKALRKLQHPVRSRRLEGFLEEGAEPT